MHNQKTMITAFALALVAAGFGIWSSFEDTAKGPIEVEHAPQKYSKLLATAYINEGCWQCHSVSTISEQLENDFWAFAAGARPTGPDLAGIGGLYAEGWHVAHFKDPQALVPGSLMPSQPQLFDDEGKLNPTGKAIVKFLSSLDEPSKIRTPWPTKPTRVDRQPNTTNGHAIFQSHCASCHGANANGQGWAAQSMPHTPPANISDGRIVRRYFDAELGINDVYTTVTNGIRLRNMPSFNGVLSKQERSDVAAYVMKLYNQSQSK